MERRIGNATACGLLWLACLGAAAGMASAQMTEVVLHNFTGGAGGAIPAAGVIRDKEGNLYGTTYAGGSANAGTVYRLDTAHHLTVLYSFTGGADGGSPISGVVRDSAGNLYGTSQGGPFNSGVVYKLDASGSLTVLYTFTGNADGGTPAGGVIRDSGGNLYGTAVGGGTGTCGPEGITCGVVYEVDTSNHETVLYSFTSVTDGYSPIGSLVRDSAGNLYGTTQLGGAGTCAGPGWVGCGVVYKVDTSGHETVLHSFTGSDGLAPQTGVIRDSSGNLYGTTEWGGAYGYGVVFKVGASGHERVLHSFCAPSGCADGSRPMAGVVRDSAGNLYGTSMNTVYKVDTAGNLTVLYSFAGEGNPNAVILGKAGNLYGTTGSGGKHNYGIVFELKP